MFSAMTEFLNIDILATIGILITAAFIGSKAFQRLGIPQVVGFIVVGTLCGTSFLNIIPSGGKSRIPLGVGISYYPLPGYKQLEVNPTCPKLFYRPGLRPPWVPILP